MKFKNILLVLAVMVTGLSSCEKMLEVDTPVNQLISAAVFRDSATAQAAMNGTYSLMYNGTAQLVTSSYGANVTFIPARAADEIYLPNSSTDAFVSNSLTITNGEVSNLWRDSYRVIYNANSIIEGMEASALTASLKKQLSAEAKFIRAFCHFTLVNYFGDVPIATTTNVQTNNTAFRMPVAQVYQQIVADLIAARDALPTTYIWSQNNRTRVNKWAASAMLARVYLYTGNWAGAEDESSKVIAQTTLFGLSDLDKVFLKASTESIWQFYTNVNGYTFTAATLLPAASSVAPVNVLTDQLMGAFETAPKVDNRKATWTRTYTTSSVSYPYAFKYTTRTAAANTENEVVLRLAEQYLIRAEARTHLEKFGLAAEDLNVIRRRAGLDMTTAGAKIPLLAAIAQERRVEFFAEYGHRWFDLKRTNQADAVLSVVKGTAAWQSTDVLFPIPGTERGVNANLTQNDGYN